MLAFALMMCVVTSDDPWQAQHSGTTARLRGLCVVDENTAWASGQHGTVLRTTDGGKTWKRLEIPDAADCDFRDIEAFDKTTAWILAIGPGERSRIYKTGDAGLTWKLVHQLADPRGFLDAIAFWDPNHGIAVGDPVEGKFMVLVTNDAGESWHAPEQIKMPAALEREGAFAASGTCLVADGNERAYFATGGAGVSRVFHTPDQGRTWQFANTPILAGNASSGAFSLAFHGERQGIAVGGDYQNPDHTTSLIAITENAGETWIKPRIRGPRGYRSCVAWSPGTDALVAVGPTGTDILRAGATAWERLSEQGFHACAFAKQGGLGWAVGENGAIARIELPLKPR